MKESMKFNFMVAIDSCLATCNKLCCINCSNEMAKVFILWPRIFGFDSDWFDSGWYTSHFSERWYRILGRHGITKNSQYNRINSFNLVRCLNCHRHFSKSDTIFNQSQSQCLFLDQKTSSYLKLSSYDSC